MFVEIKKCPLPGSYEKADDVSVLSALGDGMLCMHRSRFCGIGYA